MSFTKYRKEKRNLYIIRVIRLKNKINSEERCVYQIHFIGWPDYGIPDISDGKIFITFSEMNRYIDNFNINRNPIIVHCSAGVGRTGTFICMYLIEKEILYQIQNKFDVIRINVFNLIIYKFLFSSFSESFSYRFICGCLPIWISLKSRFSI